MSKFDPTAEEVRRERDATGNGVMTVKRDLRQIKLLEEVEAIRGDWQRPAQKIDRILDVLADLIRHPLS